MFSAIAGDSVDKVSMHFQVIFNAGPRQCGISDHDSPAGGDGVRHRGLETAALRPNRPKPGEQKPSQAAAEEVRKIQRAVERAMTTLN